jgi:hypothetical protein
VRTDCGPAGDVSEAALSQDRDEHVLR